MDMQMYVVLVSVFALARSLFPTHLPGERKGLSSAQKQEATTIPSHSRTGTAGSLDLLVACALVLLSVWLRAVRVSRYPPLSFGVKQN